MQPTLNNDQNPDFAKLLLGDDFLKIKHLAPYLPYGLKAKLGNDTVKIIGVHYHSIQVSSDYKHYGYSDIRISDVKPILIPLSALQDDINVNNKKFNPRKILELIDEENYYSVLPFNNWTKININVLNNCPYWFTNQLIQWHFDVFGLIDKGLAISIHDVVSYPKIR